MGIVCNSIDSYTKNIAKELEISDGYASNLISTWQTVNATAGINPTAEDLKGLMNSRDVALDIPVYILDDTFDFKNLAYTRGERGSYEIHLTPWFKEKDPMQLFFNYIYGNVKGVDESYSSQKKKVFENLAKEGYTESKLRGLIDTPQIANRFLLYHEMSHVQNDDKAVYWLQGRDPLTPDKIEIETRATREALQKLEEWKKLNTPNKQPATSAETDVPRVGTDVMSIKQDTPFAKLSREMSVIERHDRVVMIAKRFSSIVDSLLENKIEEINEELANTTDYEEKARLIAKLLTLNDSVKGRRAIIEDITVGSIFDMIKEEFESYTELTAEELDEDYGEGMGAHILDSYNRILNNFEPLIEEACILIEGSEGLRIVVNKGTKYSSSSEETATLGTVTKDTDTESSDEENFGDDEDGNRADGNGGWSFKVRFVDPHASLSKGVKKVLSNIKREGYDGEPEVDDLGYARYVNGEYAHAVLLNDLSYMIDPSDFCTRTENEDGTYEYDLVALKKVALKYPWVNQVITALKSNPDLISSFYADFRKDFIPYTMYKMDPKEGKWKFFHMNRATALDSTKTQIMNNYQQGVELDANSIYSLGGLVSKSNAEMGSDLMDAVITSLREFSEDDYEYILNTVTKGLRMLGLNTNRHIIAALLSSPEGYNNLEKVVYSMKDIFSGIATMPKDAHLLDTFGSEFNTIAELVGEVSELDNVQSFRQGDKSYYSYSAPNYLDTMFKFFKSNERRESYLMEQFAYDKWFFDKGEWRNEWLRQIAQDEDVRDMLELDELNNINGEEYTNWNPVDIKRTFIAKYFSAGYNVGSKKQFAWYNFPIFSDSPIVKFVKFTRYTKDYKDKLKPLFKKLIEQELYRIKKVQDRRKAGVNAIANYDKNGGKFHFMPELNSYMVGEKTFLEAIVEAKSKQDTNSIDSIINNAVETIMNANFKDFLKQNMTEESIGMLVESLISEGVINSEEGLNDALEEYFWNSTYATSQIIQLTTTDLAFYKNGVDFQKRYKEVYAAGTKLNTLSKYGRDMEKSIYLSDQIITSANYNDIKKSLQDAVKEGHISKSDMRDILEQFKDINVADAQAYRSLKSYRAVLDMMGAWTPEMQATMDRLEKGEWKMEDLNTVWQTIKPFVFTQVKKDDGLGGSMKVPHQNKNSEFLLLAMYPLLSAKTGTSAKLRALNQFMEDNDIDVVQFESAVKAGKQGCININYSPKKLAAFLQKNPIPDVSSFEEFKEFMDDRLDEGSISQEDYNSTMEQLEPSEEEVYNTLSKAIRNEDNSLNKDVVHEIPYSDYVIQQPTPEHLFDVEAVFGSQFRNLIISDMPDDPNFRVKVNGKDYTKEEVIRLYQSIIVENLLEDFTKVKGRFGNIETLQSEMLKQIKGNPKYGRDMLEALQIVEITNPVTNEKEKVFNIPLSNPSTTGKIQELITSMFKNAVTKQHIKGGACILVSNFGLTDDLHILHNEDGSIKGAECYLPAYSKQFYAPFVDDEGVLHLDDWTDKEGVKHKGLPKELRKLVGYRIPTEDKYSMMPLIIKGFLPQQNGSSIMLPADITRIAGSDFDVDKMFLMIPEFKMVNVFDIKGAWDTFYIEHPDIVEKIEESKQVNFKRALEEVLSQNPNIDEDTIDKDLLFNKFIGSHKNYEWVEGVQEEFSKWFANNKKNFIIGTEAQKVTYNTEKEAKDQTRAARNNMLIDISYGILTNKDTAEKIHNPGNFDKAKVAARVANIINNKEMFEEYMNSKGFTNPQEAAKGLLKADLAELDEFVEANRKERNPLSLDTFIYNHKQNMTGGALIGMYANNTTMQAKFQGSGLAIKSQYQFTMNGRRIDRLDETISKLGERISKNCANFSAASVDNVKDPVLADLLQNTQTANIAGFMLRAGMSIQEIGLMFTQPIVKDCILNEGSLIKLNKYIKAAIEELGDNGGSIDLSKALVHDFTSEELIMNSVGNLYIDDMSDQQFLDHLSSNIRAALLMRSIANMASDLSALTKISRADSPNGAVATSIAGAKIQTQNVNMYEINSKKPTFHLTGTQNIMKNDYITPDMSKDVMREKLMNHKMPMLQAFYSLGIELANKTIAPYFTQTNHYTDAMVNIIFTNSKYDAVPDEKFSKILNTFYNELIEFGLTKTKLFGDDGTHTYDEKRDYYLYEYPKEFTKVAANNPEIFNKLNAIRKMKVENNNIVMSRSGRLTAMMRESLMRDFDTLLYMGPEAQKLAIDLFMYSFYKEGLKFGPNSFGTFFSTAFINSFPEFVMALRQMKYDMQQGTYFDRFLPQFYANHYLDGLLPNYDFNVEELETGQILIDTPKVLNTNVVDKKVWSMIIFNGKLYSVDAVNSGKEKTVYVPSVMLNDPQGAKYNANMDVLDMAKIQPKDTTVSDNRTTNTKTDKKFYEEMDDSYLENLNSAFESLEGEGYDKEESMSQLEQILC